MALSFELHGLRGRRRGPSRRARRLGRIFWKIFLPASAASVLFFGASLISYNPAMELHRIILLGIPSTERRETMRAEAAFSHVFAAEGARLFSPWNIFLYPRRALLNAVVSSSPRIANASAVRGGPILLIAVSPRAPLALWCDADTEKQCLSVDETGYGFARMPRDPLPTLPIVFEGGSVVAGTRYMSESAFALVRDSMRAAERIGLSLARVRRGAGNDMSFVLADGTEVRLTLSSTAADLFLALPETLAAAHLKITNGSVAPPLHYFDLRFRDQVVFKRR